MKGQDSKFVTFSPTWFSKGSVFQPIVLLKETKLFYLILLSTGVFHHENEHFEKHYNPAIHYHF